MTERKLSPCALEQIADSGQCFRMQAQEEGWWRVCARDKCVYVRQDGDTLSFDCPEDEWEAVWRPYFDWDTDYRAFLAAVPPEDAFLSAAAAYGSGLRILRQDLWETLVTFVISQNNNIPRIRASVEALCRGWGEKRLDSRGEAYYTFPGKAALARAGAHAALLALPGVGRKVAHCVQLFGLHDLSAFPVDTWIRKLCDKHYAGAFPVERYPGFAGVIQQYIFFYGRSKEQE